MSILRAAVLALATPSIALAQTAPTWTFDRYAPVAFRADDESVLNAQTCSALLKGAAEVTQDRVRLLGRTLKMQFSRDASGCTEAPERVEAEGDVRYVTPLEAVRAEKALYDIAHETISFSGDVILTRGQNVSTSQTLVIDLKTNAVRWGGGVQAVFYPPKP